MEKAILLEKNHRDVKNVYGDITGKEYDIYFGDIFIGVIDNDYSFGPYGSATGMFKECETTSPLTEIAQKMGVELFYPSGKPVPKYC